MVAASSALTYGCTRDDPAIPLDATTSPIDRPEAHPDAGHDASTIVEASRAGSGAILAAPAIAHGYRVRPEAGRAEPLDGGATAEALVDATASPYQDARSAEANATDASSSLDGDAAYLPGRPEVICVQVEPVPVAPATSTFIFDASVESDDTLALPSNGDLWPSCWTGDALYAGWGDGFGFSEAGAYPRPNIGVARITGDPSMPDAMSGQTLVHDRGDVQAIFKVWTQGPYYQKPTGMLCTPGKMFLAVQDLNSATYGDAPAATIAVSLDSGQTWVENPTAPMFSNHEFTTVMFLDYGQDGAWAVDSYIYVYGLDYNWRYSETTTSPQGLYLARVPSADAILDRTTWEYFAGTGDADGPAWTANFAQRLPVLVDCTRRYATPTFAGYSVISQGSVVYDAPRKRYLYTSWTEYTFEFYESATPWGPWHKFFYRDFGPAPWTAALNGGYATTIPSKFISPDGGAMWVQSNSWSSGVAENNFALRTLSMEYP
jgi:hypothetical protein